MPLYPQVIHIRTLRIFLLRSRHQRDNATKALTCRTLSTYNIKVTHGAAGDVIFYRDAT